MKRSSKHLTAATAFALVLFSVPTLWAADDADAAADSSVVRVTTFRGRPPFKRQILSSEETAELARFEETASGPTSESIRVVDYRGRPPFRRTVVSADEVAELARFEETSSSGEGDRRTRRGPPGKLNSRR